MRFESPVFLWKFPAEWLHRKNFSPRAGGFASTNFCSIEFPSGVRAHDERDSVGRKIKLDIALVRLKETRSTRCGRARQNLNAIIFVGFHRADLCLGKWRRSSVRSQLEGCIAPPRPPFAGFYWGGVIGQSATVLRFYLVRSRYLLIVDSMLIFLRNICVTGLITTSGRKLDRENQAEHVLEVSQIIEFSFSQLLLHWKNNIWYLWLYITECSNSYR